MIALSLVCLLLALIVLTADALAGEPVRIGRQRQLFLDDFLIASASRLTRRVCPVEKHPGNPIVVREAEWEPLAYYLPTVIRDEEEGVWKLWADGDGSGVFYSISDDGIQWHRPPFEHFSHFDGCPTNRVVLSGHEDFAAKLPERQAALVRSSPPGWRLHVNAAVKFGMLNVSLLDAKGRLIEKAIIQGQDAADIPVAMPALQEHAGSPVQLEFALGNGQLYSFWVD